MTLRTITLTNRPPVRIDEDQWPVIADGTWTDHDGQVECQANRRWKMHIRVRQHTDGRAVVYSVYEYDTQFQHEADFTARSGQLLACSEDISAAIIAVGDNLYSRLQDVDGNAAEGRCHIRAAVAECIGELPAEVL
jgi:hypothetical protein